MSDEYTMGVSELDPLETVGRSGWFHLCLDFFVVFSPPHASITLTCRT